MTFQWPFMLVGLIFVPLVIWYYLVQVRRRLSQADRFAGYLPAAKQSPGFRRHVPPLLFLLSLVIILVSLARPQAKINLPRVEGTVMLVFDVSASMGAADVPPTRMEAAKAAAREFVLSQPETVQIGIVAFSGSGFTLHAPNAESGELLAAINRLEPESGTSLGQGILTALSAVAVDAGLVSAGELSIDALPTPAADQPQEQGRRWDRELLARLPEGPYPPSVIAVLLSDGENTTSLDPLEAAGAAADRGVRIDALGFGTAAGADLQVDGFIVHTALDEGALEQITRLTGGSYFAARGDTNPLDIFRSITPQLVVKPENLEITALFAGASILVLLVGSLFSLLWFNRLL